MSKVQVSALSIENWQDSTITQLRIYCNHAFTASTGEYVPQGSPSDGAAYQALTLTLSGTTLTIPQFILDSTTDGIDSQVSRYSAYFFTSSGTLARPFEGFTSFAIGAPMASASGCIPQAPATSCCVWSDIRIFNQGNAALFPDDYYTKIQINRLLTASGVGTAITNLNGQTGTAFPSQTFSVSNDTNITLGITSSAGMHNFAPGWAGTLAKSRTLGTTVYTDQANAFGAFVQKFQAGNFLNIVDPIDTTKVAKFDVSNVATATTRIINVPNANSTTAQAIGAVASNWLTAMSAQGIFTQAQPTFSDLSGSAIGAQLPATAVQTNQLNTYTAGLQDFSAIGVTVKVPIGAGLVPTVSGLVGYDSTANAFVGGVNGSTKTFTVLGNATTGSGSIVLATSPTLVAPALGTATTTGITPVSAGNSDVGSTALPFGNIWLGGAGTNNIKLTGTASAARVITFPNVTGNVITSGDSATVTNTMLAGSITAAKLVGTDIATLGTITAGIWQSTAIGAQYGGTGIDSHSSSGVPSVNAGVWGLNAITTNGISFGAASNAVSFTSAVNNAVLVTSGVGVPSLAATSANLQVSGSQLDTIQGIQITSTPQFLRLGLNQTASATTAAGVTGPTMAAQATNSVASLQAGSTYTKNTNTALTWNEVLISPTLNFGASNANTTLNILNVDTAAAPLNVNAATTFLQRWGYATSTVATMDTTGSLVLNNNLTTTGTINKVTVTAPASSATLTLGNASSLTTAASKTIAINNGLTLAGVDGTTQTFQATDTIVGRATTDTLSNKTLGSSTTFTGPVTMTLGSDAEGDIYYRHSGLLTRLAVGTNGQVLGSNGTIPGWTSAGTGTITSGASGNFAYYTGTTTLGPATNRTWTDGSNLDTITYAGITALTDVLLLRNTTAATAGTKLQFAPAIHQAGAVWDQTLAVPASRVYDLTLSGSALSPKQTVITNVVTTSFLGNSVAKVTAAGHSLTTGQKVVVQGVTGTSTFAASVNGTWPVAVIDANTFWLIGTNANAGVWSSGGTVAAQSFGTQIFSSQYNGGGYTQGWGMNTLGQVWVGPTTPVNNAAFSINNGPSYFVDNTGGTVLTQGTQPGSNLAQDLRVNNYFGTATTTTDMYQYVMLVEGLQSVGAGNSQALVGIGINVLGAVTNSSIWAFNPGTVVTTPGLTITQRTIEADLNTPSGHVPIQVGTAGFTSVYEAVTGGGHATTPFDTNASLGSSNAFAEGLWLRWIGYVGGPFQSNNAVVDFASNSNVTQYGLNAANQGANNQAVINGAVVHGDNNQVISSALNAARNADLAITKYDTLNNLLLGDASANAAIINAPFLAGSVASNGTFTIKGTSGTVGSAHLLLNPISGGLSTGTTLVGASTAEVINVNDMLHLRAPDGGNALLTFDAYKNGVNVSGKKLFRTAAGTFASPAALAPVDLMGVIAARGYFVTGGPGFTTSDSARISFVSVDSFTSTANGTAIQFETTSKGSAAAARVIVGGFAGQGIFNMQGGGTVTSAPTITPPSNIFHVTGTNTITDMTTTMVGGEGVQAGTVLILIFDGILTFTNGNHLKLKGGTITTAANTVVMLVFDGSNYYGGAVTATA